MGQALLKIGGVLGERGYPKCEFRISFSLLILFSLLSLSPISLMVELRSGRSVVVRERSPSPVGARMNTPGDRARVRFVFGDISKYFPSKVKLYFSWSFSPQGIIFCHCWGHFIASAAGMGCPGSLHGIRAKFSRPKL